MKHKEILALIQKTIIEVDKINSKTYWTLDGHFTWRINDINNAFLGRVNAIISAKTGNITLSYKSDIRTYSGIPGVRSTDITSDLENVYNTISTFDQAIIDAHNIQEEE